MNDDEIMEFFSGDNKALCDGRTVPIIGDDYVDMEFGTGALKASLNTHRVDCVCIVYPDVC